MWFGLAWLACALFRPAVLSPSCLLGNQLLFLAWRHAKPLWWWFEVFPLSSPPPFFPPGPVFALPFHASELKAVVCTLSPRFLRVFTCRRALPLVVTTLFVLLASSLSAANRLVSLVPWCFCPSPFPFPTLFLPSFAFPPLSSCRLWPGACGTAPSQLRFLFPTFLLWLPLLFRIVPNPFPFSGVVLLASCHLCCFFSTILARRRALCSFRCINNAPRSLPCATADGVSPPPFLFFVSCAILCSPSSVFPSWPVFWNRGRRNSATDLSSLAIRLAVHGLPGPGRGKTRRG